MKVFGFHRIITTLAVAFMLAFGPQAALAQEGLTQDDLVGPVPEETPASALESVDAAEAADVADPDAVAPGSDAAEGIPTPPVKGIPTPPTPGKGMPMPGEYNLQDQYSETGRYANVLHVGLVWMMALISLFVLGLLLYVVLRFNKRANPVPSKTSHNTLVEVIWTVVPALILLVIAIPSIQLLAKQYKSPPADAITIKAVGYQWYWGYAYPDNGDFEIISNMLDEDEARQNGEPFQLAVDNRMVVPAGVPIRLQVTAADVIHSFAVPSLWFKLDAVPGRLNERMLTIDEPGVYYGQCSELCGARHGFMPIAVEALPMDEYNAWVLAQGGTIAGAEEAGIEADPEAVPNQEPESAVPGAPGAGAAPVEDVTA